MTKLRSRDAASSGRQLADSLRALNREDVWHWWNTVLVIMLLTGAIIALTVPQILDKNNPPSPIDLAQAVRALLGLVLIFNVYMLYQQHLLRKMRSDLSRQVEIATEQRVRAETFYELSILDPLTGLYNRRFSEEHLQVEIARAERAGTPLVVLMLDLDNFKEINDCFGHAAGDLVLKESARRLSRAIRGSDRAVRLGGDEFLVILSECPPEKVAIVLSRLKDFEIELDGEKVLIATSGGWAQYQGGDTAEELIKRADEALYAHKTSRFAHV